MIFLIETVERIVADDEGMAVKAERFIWTLHRKEKTEVGEAICRSVETYPTERQCRAAINVAKRAMGGVRFAQTRVKGQDA